jgi:hypothetical protein
MLAVGVQLPWQLVGDPGERDIRLRAAQLFQRGPGDLDLSRHTSGNRQHPISAGEIAALPDGFARKTDSFMVVLSDKLRIGRDTVVNRRERIARAQP